MNLIVKTEIVFLILTLSCSSKGSNEILNKVDSVEESSILDLCTLSGQSPDSISQFVLKNSYSVVKSVSSSTENEQCIFLIIDILSESKNLKTKSFRALEELNNHSDGFLTEYMMEVAVRMYDRNFGIIFNYVFQNQNSSLNRLIVEGLSMEASMEEVDVELLRQKGLSNLKSNKQKDYLSSLLDKVDPKKFD